MGKTSTFCEELRLHLETELVVNASRVDCVVVTARPLAQAIDAGILKTGDGSRVERAVIIRRATELPSEIRAGANRRLNVFGLFDVVILVNASIASDEAVRENDRSIAYEIFDLSDDIQTIIEDMPVNEATSAHSVEVNGLTDFDDPASKFFGSIISIQGNMKQI